MYDIIIVGGGPAGLTAALYGLRAGKSVLVIEKNGFGGQIANSPKVENIPGTKQISGTEFADRLLDQVLALDADTELETVAGLSESGGVWTVSTEEGGEYQGRTVILATGVKHRMLGLEGEPELIGSGISFCAVCDGAFYKDMDVAIVGGGNSALQEAILLADTCRRVTVIQNLPDFTGEKKLVEVLTTKSNVEVLFNTVITAYNSANGELTGVKLHNDATGADSELSLSGVFLAVGLLPDNEAFSSLAELDERGYFASGEDCLTKTGGIFVAGDCRRKSVRQVTTAAADGAAAALAACAYMDGR